MEGEQGGGEGGGGRGGRGREGEGRGSKGRGGRGGRGREGRDGESCGCHGNMFDTCSIFSVHGREMEIGSYVFLGNVSVI